MTDNAGIDMRKPMSSEGHRGIILSDGALKYEVVENWAKIPDDVHIGDVAAIATDRSDNVYLFTRGGEHPMLVLDRQGNPLRSWGHDLFTTPHGIQIGADDCVYCTDDGAHTVSKLTLDGKLLLRLGVPRQPAPFMSGEPFHRCTHTALSPDGNIYVSDGYGNGSIHTFAPDGRHLFSWGQPGSGPGEFYVPHNIVCDDDGWVYVADRENHRIQVFDGKGSYEAQWNNLHRPCGLCMGSATSRRFYVSELGPAMRYTLDFPNLGPRISILDDKGAILGRLSGGPAAVQPGRFVAPHGIAVDAHGDIYIGEVSYGAWSATFPDIERPTRIPTIHKLRLIADDNGL